MLVKRAEQAMVRTKSAALKSVGLTPSQYVALSNLISSRGSPRQRWHAPAW